MYINPFLAGVICTILGEMLAVEVTPVCAGRMANALGVDVKEIIEDNLSWNV